MRNQNAIVAQGLRGSYGEHTVLDGINLEVPARTVFALLGPNGAGKTTMVQILSTPIRAVGGRATVAGHLSGSAAAVVQLGAEGHRP